LQISGDSFLQIRGLSVTYSPARGDDVRALDGIRLEIRRSEILGILGESGCGKSTLAHAILGLLPAHARIVAGEVLWHGRDLLRFPESELRTIRGREISWVSQQPALSLNPVMCVGSQVGEVLRAHVPSTSRERRERVCELLREVGFEQPTIIYDAYPHQLSGGQRQRVVIAQSVACRPALLIADEPTSKLDGLLRSEIVGLLSKLRERYGTAIVVITHDPTLCVTFADRVALMYAGRVVEVGNSTDVFARPLHPYAQALVGLMRSSTIAGARAKGHFPSISGESPDPTGVSIGCRFEPRCAERMEVCALRCPEDVAPEPTRLVNCFKYGD
jgi:oligopeptide/dipeptide ABC transporter ATP-binding protein